MSVSFVTAFTMCCIGWELERRRSDCQSSECENPSRRTGTSLETNVEVSHLRFQESGAGIAPFAAAQDWQFDDVYFSDFDSGGFAHSGD